MLLLFQAYVVGVLFALVNSMGFFIYYLSSIENFCHMSKTHLHIKGDGQ